MTSLVQVALAETVAEAEELQAILRAAGIDAELESAVEHHPARSTTRRRRCSSPRATSRPPATRSSR